MIALFRAAHFGPTVAVTSVTALLGVAAELEPSRLLLLVGAVLTGQLTIGWSNDLIDAERDRQVGRGDKPLATGELNGRTVAIALAIAVVTTCGLSAGLGWRAALGQVGLIVTSGVAYNLGLKRTPWSWLPYAVAFGSLPAVVTLSAHEPVLPPVAMLVAGALLGVGAHFVNVLPDLDDDAATGVQGLPHRLGGKVAQRTAIALLVGASAAVVLGTPEGAGPGGWAALILTLVLATVALTSTGRTPFRMAVAIAVVNVAILTLAA